jgi:hypothetical protein
MTQRNISIQNFIKKANKSVGAEGFLSQYREYLTTGEIAAITTPILAKIDTGNLNAKSGLEQITNAVFTHMMVNNLKKAEQTIAKANKTSSNKSVLAKICSHRGGTLSEEYFDLHQEAERWVDNRLYEGYPGSYGEVIHTKILIKGKPQTTTIKREESIGRILRKPKGAASKRVGAAAGSLGFGVKAKNSSSHFSRG